MAAAPPARGLGNRIGVFAAGQEAGLFAVDRHDVGLGEQSRPRPSGLKGLDGCAKIEAREEGEEIELVTHAGRGAGSWQPLAVAFVRWRSKLAGSDAVPVVFPSAGAEKVDAELLCLLRSTLAKRTLRRICGSAAGTLTLSRLTTLPAVEAI